MDRRKFFKIAGVTALGSVTAVGIYPFLEAKWCRLARRTITLPNLPPMFRGMTLAFISDLHHGPFVPLAYVREIVEIANSLKPDLVLLTGDYVSRHPRYIEPGIEALGKLKARIGRFAVLGNHDHWEGAPAVRHPSPRRVSLTDNRGAGSTVKATGYESAVSATSGPTGRILGPRGRCHDARCCDHAFPQSGLCWRPFATAASA